MSDAPPIRSGVAFTDYRAVDAISISQLKELRRSPMHYLYALMHPRSSSAMALGTAAHCATLEPERFDSEYVVWDRRTESGRAAPRTGKAWEAFVEGASGRQVLTSDEYALAAGMARAVRGNPAAQRYLQSGEPEVVLEWQLDGRACKGRVDWLMPAQRTVIVGLKTTRDCRHYPFAAASAKLGYALQWAWYHDGWLALTGERPAMVEIVVESAAPHAVAVYRIPDDVLEHGRDEYSRLLALLDRCQASGEWPGPVTEEEDLTLPTWVYGSDDDIGELGLEA